MIDENKFYFDHEAAEKPIRWIERFLIHSEGVTAGTPFILLDWQKEQVIRPLFGWKRKDTGRRRYQELFLLTAKGAGKTPLLAAIGLYCLLVDGEASPHVISMAASFEQASHTFNFAKAYIENSPTLKRFCDPKQYVIRASKWGGNPKRQDGKWTLISGKPIGRSGSRPSCCIADEAHEWEAPTAQSYNLVSANLFKRAQPLLLVATNAPNSTTSFCYRLYDRAKQVLDGTSDDETLLPIIFEAPKSLDWTSEAAAKAANPSIPGIISFEQLKPRLLKAKETPQDEAEYRRLYLSQQAQSGNNWLDLPTYDQLTADLDPEKIKECPVYVGIDLSEGAGDLCAASILYCLPDSIFVEPMFWLPRATATSAEERFATPYKKWELEQAITLVDEPTISPTVQLRIGQSILDKVKGHKVKAVCYDRYRADYLVKFLESKGQVCVPIGQGFGVSQGCSELDRRMREGSIRFARNNVLRSHVEVVEVEYDHRGNYWPVKSGRKGKFQGKASHHIDGVSALVSALTEARKFNHPNTKVWTGTIGLLNR